MIYDAEYTEEDREHPDHALKKILRMRPHCPTDDFHPLVDLGWSFRRSFSGRRWFQGAYCKICRVWYSLKRLYFHSRA